MYSRFRSRSKFSLPLVEFGEMPAGGRLLEHAGYVRQLAVVFFLTMSLHRLKQEMEGKDITVFPINNSDVWSPNVKTSACQVWHRSSCYSSVLLQPSWRWRGEWRIVLYFELLRLSMVLQVSKSAGAHSLLLVSSY
jgi:hypothetical protein